VLLLYKIIKPEVSAMPERARGGAQRSRRSEAA
jgi:hypothetical protein